MKIPMPSLFNRLYLNHEQHTHPSNQTADQGQAEKNNRPANQPEHGSFIGIGINLFNPALIIIS